MLHRRNAMSTRRWSEIAQRIDADPERRTRVDEHKRAMKDAIALHEARAARRQIQGDLAATLDVTQANGSRIERQDNLYLSTLEEYVAALGGRLELQAIFPDRVIALEVRPRQRSREATAWERRGPAGHGRATAGR